MKTGSSGGGGSSFPSITGSFFNVFTCGCKSGFTLAEVLITLGIIGVVAALTIPALIHSYKKQVVETRLRKFYSMMSQAIQLSEIDNGPADEWIKPVPGASSSNVAVYFNKYIKPYIKTVSMIEVPQNQIFIEFADSSTMYFMSFNCMDIHFDINGQKAPNKYGYDTFYFLICPQNMHNSYRIGEKSAFGVYSTIDTAGKSREEILNLCKTKPEYCTYLLLMDNWKIKRDYPHKLY